MFAKLPLDDKKLVSTFDAVVARLQNTSPIGGVIRFEADDYFLSKSKYKGNPWVICTLWLAQYYVSTGKKDEAEKLIKWTLERQQHSGALSEQFDPETGVALSVTPLVWSHAELVNTILDFSDVD